jgi:uncharacterized protein (TIRG00374 family)
MPRYAIALIVSIAISIVGYIAFVRWSGSEETFAAMGRLGFALWIPVLALSLANYLTRYYRWNRYLTKLHPIAIPMPTHILIYFSGFALTTTPGKAGEAVRGVLLKRYFQVGYTQSLSAFFVERLMDLLSVLTIVAATAPAFLGERWRWPVFFVLGLGLLLLPLLHNRNLLAWSTRQARTLPRRLRNLARHLLALLQSSSVLLQGRLLYQGLGLGLIAWLCEGIALYIILQGMDADVSLTVAIGIYAVSTLIGAISLVPGGLGGTEISMVAMLVATGTDNATAAGATLICRIASLWFAVLLGMLAAVYLGLSGMERRMDPGAK